MIRRCVYALVEVCLVLALVLHAERSTAQAPPALPQAPPEAAPPNETGSVTGVVVDKSTGEAIIEASVEVVDHGTTVKTDLDGHFKIELPAGSYQLRIFAPLYQPVRLQGVTVKPHEVTKQNASLSVAQGAMQVVEVVARADKAAEATQLAVRKNSPVVSDTVSAESIKKSPDADAAKVVQRTPSVTIKDDRFVFVRGLGERYTSSLLNGSRLPSPDPDKRVVPLDLFPSDFIESLSIIKSYTPDLPGDFSGGLVDIHLREYPEQFTFTTGASLGANSQTTFQSFRGYKGGSLDYLGLGSNFRKLPESVPDTDQFRSLGIGARDNFGRAFENIYNTSTFSAPPNTNFNFAVGDTTGPFGFTLGGIYKTEYQTIPDRIERQYVNGGNNQPIHLNSDFLVDDSVFTTRLGGVLTATYKLTDNDKLFFRSLIDRNTFDLTQVSRGLTTQGLDEQTTTLRYTEEELDFGQLGGEHRWSDLWLDWRTAYSRSKQDEPDTRYITYLGPPGSPLSFNGDSLGGDRIFNTLTEKLTDSAVDFTVPFKTALPFTDVWSGLPAKIKFGPAYAYRDRSFDQRRFTSTVLGSGGINLQAPPETVLDPKNYVPGLIDFQDTTIPGDTYKVTQEIIGGYGMIDLPLIRDRLRFIGGERLEASHIRLMTEAIGATQSSRINKNDVDKLPGLNLVFSPRDDMNFRLGYSRSVSRPEFRELSPTQYPSPRGLRPLIGNPNLVETKIKNYDARWEWFFSPLEVVSLSFFHKELEKPIEQTVIVESSLIADSFKNAKDGELTGFEFEGRKDFGFITPSLRNLSIATNFAYIDSTVTVPRKKLEVQTSTSRALQGQAPYIANGVLEYAHPEWGTYRLLYYTAGPRVTSAGSFGLPDIQEERRDQLDVAILFPIKPFDLPLLLKLTAENLLDDRILLTQGGHVQRMFSKGVKTTIGLSYSY